MKTSVFVVMNEFNSKILIENYKILQKQFFKLGLDIAQFAVVEDLLGVDYKSFGTGLKIFIEDEDKKASSLLVPLNKMDDFGNGIFASAENNMIVINKTILESMEDFKKIVNDVLKINYDNFSIKCFGINEENLCNYLKEFKNSNNVFDYFTQTEYGDSLIVFRFISSVAPNIKDGIVSMFVKDLKDTFYASKDVSLSRAVFEILTLRKIKISTAESFTSGQVANTIIRENAGASAIIEDAYVVYSDKIKHTVLGVEQATLQKYTAVSAETAYEMIIGLLNKSSCDIAIATTGYANHTDPKLSGLFFTAVGDKDAVHVYRHKIDGDREFVIRYGANVAIFELIKKLRQNALNISNFAI